MNNFEALATLESALATGAVPPRDVEFVGSLVKQHTARGLSDKQWYWVVKLAERMVAPAPEAKVVADFGRVYAMFAKAREHLKFPKIHLSVNDRHLKLYVSGARSRLPGVVNVTDDMGETWYGRIYEDGRWEQSQKANPADLPAVEEGLRQFAADPEGVAAAHGKLHGACCFCNRHLEDERSTDVGYGPVCAKRFSLRWGNKEA